MHKKVSFISALLFFTCTFIYGSPTKGSLGFNLGYSTVSGEYKTDTLGRAISHSSEVSVEYIRHITGLFSVGGVADFHIHPLKVNSDMSSDFNNSIGITLRNQFLPLHHKGNKKLICNADIGLSAFGLFKTEQYINPTEVAAEDGTTYTVFVTDSKKPDLKMSIGTGISYKVKDSGNLQFGPYLNLQRAGILAEGLNRVNLGAKFILHKTNR